MSNRSSLTLVLAITIGLPVLAVSTKFSTFTPLASSASPIPVGDPAEATPMTLSSPSFTQRTIADRATQNALVPDSNSGNWDMVTSNETGPNAGRYLFMPFETGTAGVQRVDTQNPDYNARTVTIVAPGTQGFVAGDALMWTIVGVVGWYFRRTGVLAAPTGVRTPTASVAARGPIDWIVRLAFGATTLLALAAVTAAYRASPHGEWDAWAIWNLHARFLFRGGDEWRTLFQIDWSQPAYPLLMPASVARVWAYAGHETTLGPALVALAFVIATVLLVMTALDLNRRRAWIAGSLLIGAGGFLAQVSSQCADVPLACFIVATLSVACGRKGC